MHLKKQDPAIVVQITKEFKKIDVRLSKLKKLVEATCKRFGLSRVTVSIAIVGDDCIRKVNKQFLNHNSITDCLSFDLSGDKGVEPQKDTVEESSADFPRSFDLVVNGEMAIRESHLRGHSSEAELALYITHGLLHNLGFDDCDPRQAKRMHKTEDEILQQFGFGLVYNP